MLHRLEKLFRNCRLDEPRIGIVSLWDVENKYTLSDLKNSDYAEVKDYTMANK